MTNPQQITKNWLARLKKTGWWIPLQTLGRRNLWEFVGWIGWEILRAKNEERERIEKLIINEMLIARQENQPTSRLTSLLNQLKNNE